MARAPEGDFPHPYLAVDVVVLTVAGRDLKTLLVRPEPTTSAESWALPGTFVQRGEALPDAVRRVLSKKAKLDTVFSEQLFTFGDDVERDPRRHVVTVVYYALVDDDLLSQSLTTGRHDRLLASVLVPWKGDHGDPWTVIATDDDGTQVDLAFDHRRILGSAINRIRGKLNFSPIGFQLLPAEFTLRELRAVHEALLADSLNADTFRKRMIASNDLEATGATEDGAGHRPAELYRCIEATRPSAVGSPRPAMRRDTAISTDQRDGSSA
jgi:8-oxo-dGTP diphosphatase